MTYLATKDDYSLIFQSQLIPYAKIEILNEKSQTEESITGNVISCDSSISADSQIRRTCNMTISVTDSSFDIGSKNKIWYTKFVRVWDGYYSFKRKEIMLYLSGTYLFNDVNFNYDSISSTLTLSCIDLVALLDGTRNGYTIGNYVKIEAGSRTKDVLKSLVTQEGKLKKYKIDEYDVQIPEYLSGTVAPTNQIPYDMEFGLTDTVWSKISKISSLYPGWEDFIDTDGTFIHQKIPTCESDECVLTADVMEQLVIGEPISVTFSDIANVTDVYGQSIDADRYSSQCVTVGNNYSMTMTDDLSFDGNTIPSNTKIEIVVNSDNILGQTMSFNGSKQYKICYEDGTQIEAGKMISGINYVVKYTNNILVFLGEYQVHAICKEIAFVPTAEQIEQDKIIENCDNIKYVINPQSPFAIKEMWVGEIRNPLSGGEYDAITSSYLALQRAEYENWLRTRLPCVITFTMKDVPWLDVNQKIEYKSKRTGKTTQYITKSISRTRLSGIATVSCSEFFPLYPFIVK